MVRRCRGRRDLRTGLVLGVVAFLAAVAPAQANHTPSPTTVTLVGSLQSELGCPGDWQPECPATVLQPAGGGVYRGTFEVPAGNHEYKVALNGSWDENYGAGGQPGGSNIGLEAPGGPITFTYDHATHAITDDAPLVLGRERAAHWLREGLIAWDLPEQREGFSYRLHAAPPRGPAVENRAIAGGTSFPLALDASGLPAGVRACF